MGNTDKILNYVIDIKEDVAGIKEHLRQLNGKVVKQEEKIYLLQKDNIKNKLKWAKLTGIGISIGAITGFLGSLFNRIIK